MTSKKETATKLHEAGFNCAQAVLAPFCEKYGLDKNAAMRLAGGMGGGLRVGEVCGAASGGALVVGLKYGASEADDLETKKFCGGKAAEFMKAFKERHGAYACRDLLKAAGGKICPSLISGSVELLEELGY